MKLPKLTTRNVLIGAGVGVGLAYLFVLWSFSTKATGGGGLFEGPAFDPTVNL